LEETNKRVNADYLFTSLTSSLHKVEVKEYLKKLSQTFPAQKIFVTGLQIKESLKDIPNNVVKVSSTLDFIEKLKKL
jgi:hypothetical protein